MALELTLFNTQQVYYNSGEALVDLLVIMDIITVIGFMAAVRLDKGGENLYVSADDSPSFLGHNAILGVLSSS